MSKTRFIMGFAMLIFMLGWLMNSAMSELTYNEYRQEATNPVYPSGSEIASPYDWVDEKEIFVYNDRIVIKVNNPKWATFTDTNSMDPVLDSGSNAIEIIPQCESDIHIGDIVVYQSDMFESMIIHRVIDIKTDNLGTFYVLKGDNNSEADPEKVRFNQVKRIVVAIIY